jgi:arginine deiminase
MRTSSLRVATGVVVMYERQTYTPLIFRQDTRLLKAKLRNLLAGHGGHG